MATEAQQALNATGMSVSFFCAGQSNVGIGVTGTWVGTVSFQGSFDGVNFVPISLTPFPTGAAVQSSTGNGNFFSIGANYTAVQVTFTRTSGTAIIQLAASLDSSYQAAFLSASSDFLSQSVAGGLANVLTIAAQANRGWNINTLVVGFSVAPAAAVLCTIADGGSSVLWETYIPPLSDSGAATVGGTFQVPLPPSGVTGTPGHSLVITLAAPGGAVVSKVNAAVNPG
jgi:hypothetical protein